MLDIFFYKTKDDYIVYNFETSQFEMFNIYDEVSFRESETMKELLMTLPSTPASMSLALKATRKA